MATPYIINYLSGLTGFVFDKSVLNRIAEERGVALATSLSELTQKQRDLCLADELFVIYTGPKSTASSTNQHGSYTHIVGSQSMNDNKYIYNAMVKIYTTYGETAKLALIPDADGFMEWTNENTDMLCL